MIKIDIKVFVKLRNLKKNFKFSINLIIIHNDLGRILMIANTLKRELNLADWQVKKVIKLIDEGNTIPFIARYRKDVTGSLNDETLRKFDERLKYLRNLEDKKQNPLCFV